MDKDYRPHHRSDQELLTEVFADPGNNGFYYREKMPDSVARYIREDVYDDKIDGLESDLEAAVEVAFKRGATEWTRLNYPALYERFNTR